MDVYKRALNDQGEPEKFKINYVEFLRVRADHGVYYDPDYFDAIMENYEYRKYFAVIECRNETKKRFYEAKRALLGDEATLPFNSSSEEDSWESESVSFSVDIEPLDVEELGKWSDSE